MNRKSESTSASLVCRKIYGFLVDKRENMHGQMLISSTQAQQYSTNASKNQIIDKK